VHGANAPVWKGPEEAALPAVLEAPDYALPGRFEHVLCAVLRECSHTGWSGRALSRSRALWEFLKKKKIIKTEKQKNSEKLGKREKTEKRLSHTFD